MTRWLQLAPAGVIIFALALILLTFNGSWPNLARAQTEHIDQVSIDVGPTGTNVGVEANGKAASGDRNGDGLSDAEGTLEGVCPFGTTTDTGDDDGDTVVNDGCPGGPATVGTPETGLCGNGVDDDPYKPTVGAIIFDGVADDGCVLDLSALETCIEISVDGVLNADEDLDVDLASIDVTVGAQPGPGGGVPAPRPLTAFQFDLNWSVDVLDVLVADQAFLIHSAGARTPYSNIQDLTPADSPYTHAVADAGPAETGPGVLDRFLIQGNSAGLAVLSLTGVSLRDTGNTEIPVDTVKAAGVAVSADGPDAGTVIGDSAGELFTCAGFVPPTPSPTPVATPSPSPSPTPVPTPTPTPTPSPTPTPIRTPTPSPTASPAALPPTGGGPSFGGSSWAWLLIAMGMAAGVGMALHVYRRKRSLQ